MIVYAHCFYVLRIVLVLLALYCKGQGYHQDEGCYEEDQGAPLQHFVALCLLFYLLDVKEHSQQHTHNEAT